VVRRKWTHSAGRGRQLSPAPGACSLGGPGESDQAPPSGPPEWHRKARPGVRR
jgi:hypothetical protein